MQVFCNLVISQQAQSVYPLYLTRNIIRLLFSVSRSVYRVIVYAPRRTIEHDSYKRAPTYLLKAPGAGVSRTREREGISPRLARRRSFRIVVIRYVRGTDAFLHRRACLCRARRQRTSGKREIE